jgi:hypothetical protein
MKSSLLVVLRLKFDEGPKIVTEAAPQTYCAGKLDYSIYCPPHHWKTAPAERGRSIHQDSVCTMGSYANTPSDLWGHNFSLSVEVHNLQLYAGADVCPYFDSTGLASDY